MESSLFLSIDTYRPLDQNDNGNVFRTLGEMADWLRVHNYEGSADETTKAEPLYQITKIRFHAAGMEIDQVTRRLNAPNPWEWCGPDEYDDEGERTSESQYKEYYWSGLYTSALQNHFGIRDVPESADEFGHIAREKLWLTPETAAVEYMRSRNRLPDNW